MKTRHHLPAASRHWVICLLVLIGLGRPLLAKPQAPEAAPASQSTEAATLNQEAREGDPRERAKYWQQRRAGIPAAAVLQAIDSARKLPAAAALPTVRGQMPAITPAGQAMVAGPQAGMIGGSPWVSFGPTPMGDFSDTFSGRIGTIAIDPVAPSTIYIGAASGGVWKSTDNGNSWTPMSNEGNQPTLSIGSIAIDPTNHNVIYAGTGTNSVSSVPEGAIGEAGRGVLKSTDAGASWTLLSQSPAVETDRILVGPTGTVWLACPFGLYRSTDGGATWTKMKGKFGFPAGFEVTDVAMSVDGTLLYAAVPGQGLYRSQNSGASWAQVPSVSLPARTRLAIAPSNSKIGYLVIDPIVLFNSSTGLFTSQIFSLQMAGTLGSLQFPMPLRPPPIVDTIWRSRLTH